MLIATIILFVGLGAVLIHYRDRGIFGKAFKSSKMLLILGCWILVSTFLYWLALVLFGAGLFWIAIIAFAIVVYGLYRWFAWMVLPSDKKLEKENQEFQ